MISQVEINRKIIHLMSLWMPLAIYFLSQKMAVILFGALLICALTAEVIRFRSAVGRNVLERIFQAALRGNEKNAHSMTGASYMLLGVFISTFFEKEIAVTATAVLMVSDTAAAIVGQAMGKTKFLGKSLAGCVAFFVSGLCVLAFIGVLLHMGADYYFSGIMAVIAATGAEIYSRKFRLDDNLTIPVIICVVMWLLT